MKAKLQQPFQWKTWHLLLASVVVGVLCSTSLAATLFFGAKLTDRARDLDRIQQEQIRANRQDAQQAKDLARALAPTDEDLAAGAAHALEVCLSTPSCRDAFRGAVRRAKLRPEDVPNLITPQPDTTASGTGGNGNGSAGNGTGSGGSPGGSDTTPPRSPSPSRNPPARRPSLPPRSPAPSPSVPAPSVPVPSRPPPSSSSTTPPPVVPTTPTVPTIPPVQPPTVTVPGVPVRVCTPVVTVNCVDPKSGRVVGPEGHAAEPKGNGGRQNESVPLCDRIKAPCDDNGNPVFPPALIGLP